MNTTPSRALRAPNLNRKQTIALLKKYDACPAGIRRAVMLDPKQGAKDLWHRADDNDREWFLDVLRHFDVPGWPSGDAVQEKWEGIQERHDWRHERIKKAVAAVLKATYERHLNGFRVYGWSFPLLDKHIEELDKLSKRAWMLADMANQRYTRELATFFDWFEV